MSHRLRHTGGLITVAVAIVFVASLLSVAGSAVAQDSQGVTVQLAEENDSGVTGTAVLTADGNQTRLQVTLEGAEAGYEGHTFDSTCDDHRAATVFYAIEAVDADGTSESIVDAPLSELQNGKFWIHMHKPAGERGEGVACGQIPAASVGGTLPASGVGPLGGEQAGAWYLLGFAVAAGLIGAASLLRRQGSVPR
jgi:hypothetical protein